MTTIFGAAPLRPTFLTAPFPRVDRAHDLTVGSRTGR